MMGKNKKMVDEEAERAWTREIDAIDKLKAENNLSESDSL